VNEEEFDREVECAVLKVLLRMRQTFICLAAYLPTYVNGDTSVDEYLGFDN
jgi:hypothetical protein